MLSTIITIVHAIWDWLPRVTVGLRFGAALIGFWLAVDLAAQRWRNRMRQHW
ncbi:MAG: hypothetical protein ACRDS9_14895 [Pseudonocardiaceae bacterium]